MNGLNCTFVAEGTQLPYEVGELSFNVHGDGATANEGPVHAVSAGTLAVSLNKSGRIDCCILLQHPWFMGI